MRYHDDRSDDSQIRRQLSNRNIRRVETILTQNLAATVTSQTINANQNDFPVPPGADIYRLDVDSTERTITGFAGGTAGRSVTLHNIGAANLKLTHEDSGSAAANRLQLPDPNGVIVQPGQTANIKYDISSLRWVMVDERSVATVALPTLTGTTNDLALGPGVLYRIQTDGTPRSITGFANGVGGRVCYFHVLGTADTTLVHNDSGSQAQNRILLPTVLGITVSPLQTFSLIYDASSARWVLIARTS